MRRGLFQRPTGDVSRRLHGVVRQLQARQRTALDLAARAQSRGEVEFAASLRGKSHGYEEAVDLLYRLDAGDAIRRRNRWERP